MLKVFENVILPNGEHGRLFVRDGRFVAEGEPDLREDLRGAHVLPGFVDAHCHILPMGLDLQKLHLGGCSSREEVVDAVRDWHGRTDPSKWLHAVHYDQTRFEDAVHLTRESLDQVSPVRPILLRHVNGHASVANSAALIAAGVDESTPDPPGGEYVRDASGRLTGVLLERAHEHVTSAAPSPSCDEMVGAILAAGDKMSALGITAATDMMTGRWSLSDELMAYRMAAEKGCKVRLRLFVQWGTVFGPRAMHRGKFDSLRDSMDPATCEIKGIKIFADGAIGSATAAIYGSFLTTGKDGQLIYTPDRLKEMVLMADQADMSLAIHTIGDRSTDLVMDAYEATGDPTRHRIEHAMLLSNAQIERMARLNAQVTMQPEFLMRFGHAYLKQLGPERAAGIKRVKSVLDAGIRLSFSSDRPIVAGNPWDGIACAAKRPAGFDPGEEIPEAQAIELYTRASALANFDPHQGALEPGFRADFQVYSTLPVAAENPTPSRVFVGGAEVTTGPVPAA